SPSSRRVRRMCPGWQRGPHAATDLVVDHVSPRTLAGGVQVLCRACNSRKGASWPALTREVPRASPGAESVARPGGLSTATCVCLAPICPPASVERQPKLCVRAYRSRKRGRDHLVDAAVRDGAASRSRGTASDPSGPNISEAPRVEPPRGVSSDRIQTRPGERTTNTQR